VNAPTFETLTSQLNGGAVGRTASVVVEGPMSTTSALASLKDALRTAYEESVAFVRRKRSLPMSDRLLWVDAGEGQARLDTFPMPSLGSLSPKARDQLFNAGAWREHDKIFMRDPCTATLITEGFAVFGWRQRFDLKNFKYNVLDELFTRTEGLQYDSDKFEALWKDLEQFYLDEDVPMQVIAPVQNLELEAPVGLGDAGFRRLPATRAARIEMPTTWEARGTIARPSAWAFVMELRFRRTKDAAPTWGADLQSRDCVAVLRATLDQLAPSRTAILAHAFEFARWMPLGGYSPGGGDGRAPPDGPALMLREDEATKLLSSWGAEHQKVVEARGVPQLIPVLDKLPTPTIAYVDVYRAHVEPVVPVSMSLQSTTVQLIKGPFDVSFGGIQTAYHGSSASGVMANASYTFPAEGGPYLVFRTLFKEEGRLGQGRIEAMMNVAEARAILELQYPGLIREHVYAGVDAPNVFSIEGSMRLVAGPPLDIGIAQSTIAHSFERVSQLGSTDDASTDRARFRLAARWYSRGLNATSDVDRLFYFWTSLEVHPTQGEQKVPLLVTQYLKQQLRLTLPDAEITARLCLTGRASITALRGELIHKGTSRLMLEEPDLASYSLRCLEIIAATCLKLLAGMDPGDELRPYLDDD
jgi:hypothetical protein